MKPRDKAGGTLTCSLAPYEATNGTGTVGGVLGVRPPATPLAKLIEVGVGVGGGRSICWLIPLFCVCAGGEGQVGAIRWVREGLRANRWVGTGQRGLME